MNDRTLLIVRTHRASVPALDAFDRYASVPGLEVTFVCDERAEQLDMGDRAKLVLTDDRLNDLGLFAHPHSGWRCGDYFYQIARAERPDFDKYWLVEPDVYLNMAPLADFFDFWRDDPSDMLAMKFGRRTPSWGWHGTVKDQVDIVHGCVYSISRLNAQSVDALGDARRAASRAVTPETKDVWPNDEAFTANTLVSLGRRITDFNGAGRTFYTEASFRNGAPFDRATLVAGDADGLIYHPARILDQWLERSHRGVRRIRDIKTRSQVSSLTRHATALLESPERADEALVPLVHARAGWAAGGWGDFTMSAEQDAKKALTAQRMIARHFGAKQGSPLIGTIHHGKSRINGKIVKTVQPDDFELDEGMKIGRVPARLALPYCWDPAAGEILYTLHTDPLPVLRQPFLYGGQRQFARVIARLRIDRLDDVFGPPDPDARLTFIFSVGRTGSTLMHTLMQQAAPRSISEPDMLTQIATNRKVWKDKPALRQSLLWHAVSAFAHLQLDGVEDGGPVTIKLRSQVNGMAEDLAAMFPNAVFVFMTRERVAWARSTMRSFAMPPERVAGRLLQGVRTIDRLKTAARNLIVLPYESVLADPVGAVEQILGRPVSEAVRTAIAETMTRDSQEGTNVSRDRASGEKSDEIAWMAAFETEWASIRPAALIEKHGLEL